MKRFAACIGRFYRSETARWIVAALVALAVIVFAFLKTTITYYDNDDLNIAWALAGYRGGSPSFSHPFVNCLTAFLVSALYTVLPKLPWWLIFQLGGLFAGMSAVNAATLKICARRNVPLLFPVLLMGLFAVGLFFYPIVLVTFTTSSAILGAGATALALAYDDNDGKPTQRAYAALIVVLLVGSMLIRNASGLSSACFVVGALLCRLARFWMDGNKPQIKRMLVSSLLCLLAVALLAGANAYGRRALNPDGFLSFENGRASYMDYPHDSIGSNPSVYEAYGWDETLTGLVDRWFYMDERVTAEAFDAIVEASAFAQMGAGDRLEKGARILFAFLEAYPLARYIGGIFALGAAALVVLFLFNRKAWRRLLTGVLLTLGGAALIGYLCYTGRMNLRSWMSVCIPSAVCVWLCAVELYHTSGQKLLVRVLRDGLVLALVAGSLFFGWRVFRTVLSYESDEMLFDSQELTQYALDRPADVFIRDVFAANNVDALSVYPNEKPTNLMDWGGCDTGTKARAEQLAINNLSSPYADVFLQDNVYYVCDASEPNLPLLAHYMEERYGASYEIVDTVVSDISVVKFTAGGAS